LADGFAETELEFVLENSRLFSEWFPWLRFNEVRGIAGDCEEAGTVRTTPPVPSASIEADATFNVSSVRGLSFSLARCRSVQRCKALGETAKKRRIIMAKQFENPQETKVEDETVTKPSTEEKINQVADKMARKPAETEKTFDKENSKLFSK
jgi:hypothetical protein